MIEKHGAIWCATQLGTIVFETYRPPRHLAIVFRQDEDTFRAVLFEKSSDPQWRLPSWGDVRPDALFTDRQDAVDHVLRLLANKAAVANLHESYRVLAAQPPATAEHIDGLKSHFGSVPQEYLDLVRDATEIEIQHQGGQYIRIWGPSGCVEMDDGYGIRQRIPGAFPMGDDGGGRVIFHANGKQGPGLYHVGYGNLDLDDAVWIAPSLTDLLSRAIGIEVF